MKSQGQIVTFYSYKGGTGRSMALANIGVLLAQWGYEVLLVDWDLEAPGLEFFFRTFLADKKAIFERDGIIDFLSGHGGPNAEAGPAKDWREMILEIRMPDGTLVHLLSAGRRNRDYFRKVMGLSVERFYSADGGVVIESLREQWKGAYDFVLVDSRTGVTDIGGICTIQLPDQLVLLFTPSEQALEGILEVCSNVRNAHEQLPVDRQRLVLLPVLSRLDVQQEFVLLQDWTKKCAERLRDIYRDWLPSSIDPGRVLEATKLPYKPFFSFGDKLAVLEEGTTDPTSLGYAYENLAALIANRLESTRSLLDDRDYFIRLASKRRKVKSRQSPTVFLCHSHKDKAWTDRIVTHLSVLAQPGNLEIWDDRQLQVGSDWVGSLEEAISRARVCLVLVSADFLASRFMVEHELPLLAERRMKEGIQVVPIILRPCAWQQVPWLRDMQALPKDGRPLSVMSESEIDGALARLVAEIGKVAAGRGPRTEPRIEPPRVLASPSRLRHGSDSLFGRERELAALDQACTNPSVHILSIVAWAGVGKTSLVVEWMARKAAAGWAGFERVFDWSFYSQGTREQGAVLADSFIAAALEFFGDTALVRSTASPWDRGARLAQLVAQWRSLLVLDGLEPLQHPPGPLAGQLRDPALAALLRGLAQRNPGLCLVTTRERVADLASFCNTTAPVLELENLSTAASAELLRTLGVRGTAAELQSLIEEVAGHALTVNLLGRYLAKAHQGDIRRRDQVKIEKADAKVQGGHAFNAIAAYDKWLTKGGEHGARQLAVLRVLGLFDRPADVGCLAALRREPVIRGLTEPLVGLSEDDWNLTLSSLADCGFIAAQTDRSAIDAHPLIREYFTKQLREQTPEASRLAHHRLYEHLKANTPYEPDSLDGLQPLLQAVAHGCAAGEHQEAHSEVYQPRIARENRQFLRDALGCVGADLAVLSHFFEEPWLKAVSGLEKKRQASVLVNAGLDLRLLGRFSEASECLEAGNAMYISMKNADRTANATRHLSQLHVLLGRLDQALALAEESVSWSEKLGEPTFQRVAALANLGDVLHQLGNVTKAEAMFKEAEAIQPRVEPKYPRLCRLQGYRYCELLLSLRKYEEVLDRAQMMTRWAEEQGFLLGRGTSLLILAQVHVSAPSEQDAANWTRAKAELEQAAESFRQARQVTFLPRGLLVRAWLRFQEGDTNGARADLDEAWEIAERGPMRLYLADIQLHRARLFHDSDALAKARKLIDQGGYHRRDEELADAEEAAKNW